MNDTKMCILIVKIVFDNPQLHCSNRHYDPYLLKQMMNEFFQHTRQLMIRNEIFIMRENIEERYGILAEILRIVSDIDASVKIIKI